jgi:hypothetical protein
MGKKKPTRASRAAKSALAEAAEEEVAASNKAASAGSRADGLGDGLGGRVVIGQVGEVFSRSAEKTTLAKLYVVRCQDGGDRTIALNGGRLSQQCPPHGRLRRTHLQR